MYILFYEANILRALNNNKIYYIPDESRYFKICFEKVKQFYVLCLSEIYFQLYLNLYRLAFAFLFSTAAGVSRLHTQFAWKTIEFNYRSNGLREQAINSGTFIPGNSVPLDVDTWREGNQLYST